AALPRGRPRAPRRPRQLGLEERRRPARADGTVAGGRRRRRRVPARGAAVPLRVGLNGLAQRLPAGVDHAGGHELRRAAATRYDVDAPPPPTEPATAMK